MISDRDVAFFHEQGYLVVPNVLDQSSVETLRQELDAIIEGARLRARELPTARRAEDAHGPRVEPPRERVFLWSRGSG
jgi:ectoine hydroxylase-related dioxygenase (phytanoyl-CoA dioxygenase family)